MDKGFKQAAAMTVCDLVLLVYESSVWILFCLADTAGKID